MSYYMCCFTYWQKLQKHESRRVYRWIRDLQSGLKRTLVAWSSSIFTLIDLNTSPQLAFKSHIQTSEASCWLTADQTTVDGWLRPTYKSTSNFDREKMPKTFRLICGNIRYNLCITEKQEWILYENSRLHTFTMSPHYLVKLKRIQTANLLIAIVVKGSSVSTVHRFVRKFLKNLIQSHMFLPKIYIQTTNFHMHSGNSIK